MSNLNWLDWTIIVVAIIALRAVSLSTRHYMKGVADFLSANRLAGRYLLTIASAMGNMGVISFVAGFEVFCKRGFAPGWWGGFSLPQGVIILMTGWVFYRFRETRALTMAQFLEMRYSRRFRVTAGVFCWLSGLINFGIFPAVAAHFFIYFCGLPQYYHIPGFPSVVHLPFALPLIGDHFHLFSTFATVMAVDLGIALSFVTMGGQVSIMITECVQGIVSAICMLIVAGYVWFHIKWPEMVHALSQAPVGESMLNPFHTKNVNDFNIWYYLIAIFAGFYAHMSWQGGQGFFSSARTPHEQRMGNIISTWRALPQQLLTLMLPLAALVILRLPNYEGIAHAVNTTIQSVPNKVVGNQMMVPIAMAHFLPSGIKGLLAVVMLFFSFTCHDTYMHSWGAIFVQDVVMPLRKKPLTPEQHIKWLRWSIIGVGVFAFVFSLLYQPTGAILFFFALTGTIWLGGSGAVIVGGLYSRWGTTAAAFSALLLGATLGIGGLVVTRFWPAWTGHDFPLNGQVMFFFAMVGASLVYTIVSLCTGGFKMRVNLDRILHRGAYRIESDQVHYAQSKSFWFKLVGITDEFSKVDRFLALYVICYTGLSFLWFVVFSIFNLIHPVSDSVWAAYWHYTVYYIAIPAIPCTIWFTVGGIIDIRALFKALSSARRDHTDDGTVKSQEAHPVEVQAAAEATPEAGPAAATTGGEDAS